MPTVLPRHTLTETPEIARALDDAARVWPDLRDNRAALLRRLIQAGHREVADREEERVEARRRAVRAAAGAMTGLYPPHAADRLKEEWPE